MLTIPFPPPQFDIRKKDAREQIFDDVRKRWVRLTPEEWVRQNFLQYLIRVKNFPASLLSVEKEILLGERKKRCDIVVFKKEQPWLIVECKQPDVPLSADTLMQVLRYNMVNCCTYLIISNGAHTKGWKIENNTSEELDTFPDW